MGTVRRRWVVVLLPVLLLGCARIVSKLRGERDSGSYEVVEPEDPHTPPRSSDGGLAALLGFGPTEEVDAGCPRDIHPGYCRRRCRGLGERRLSHHARRVWPSAGYAFGTCGPYEVFAERAPDAGGIVEYYDPDGGALVGAVDERVKPCGTFGVVPSCTPKLAWKESKLGLPALPNAPPDDE